MIETTNLPEILAQVADEIVRLEVPAEDLLDEADPRFQKLADAAAMTSLLAAAAGRLSFPHVASLVFFQAVSEEDPQGRRAELMKLAAVTVAWIDAIDKRN